MSSRRKISDNFFAMSMQNSRNEAAKYNPAVQEMYLRWRVATESLWD